MPEYFLMTANGVTPPKFVHHELGLAISEAKRLHEKYNTKVYILKVVGKVEKIEVPLTELKTHIQIDASENQHNLPF